MAFEMDKLVNMEHFVYLMIQSITVYNELAGVTVCRKLYMKVKKKQHLQYN